MNTKHFCNDCGKPVNAVINPRDNTIQWHCEIHGFVSGAFTVEKQYVHETVKENIPVAPRVSHYKTSNTKEANFWRLMYRMFWCARKKDALKAGYIMTSMRTAWITRNRAALIAARQKMRDLAAF